MKIVNHLHNNKGFTLIGLISVTIIFGILANFVAHNFIQQMPRYRLHGAARHIAMVIMQARTQAINQNMTIGVNFTNSHQYNIWYDRNNNGGIDTGEEILEDIHPQYADVSLTAMNNPSFNPRGFSNTPSAIALSNSSGTKNINITLAGAIKIN